MSPSRGRIVLVRTERTDEVITISSGDCAVEIEHYDGIGVHILINTPPSSTGEIEQMEVWATEAGLRIESHTISGELCDDGEIEAVVAEPSESTVLQFRRPR